MRPEAGEYAEFYERYVSKIEGNDIVGALQQQLETTVHLLSNMDEAKADYRYEPGKWTVKELIGHSIDTERVFAYRALVFSRGDSTALPGFDQDVWASHATYAAMSMAQIVEEFETVRRATIAFFRHLDAASWTRRGTGNGRVMTTRAAAYVIAGHTRHHLDILQTRYF